MASIEGFIDELLPLVRAASGIRYVPDDPPSSLATEPAAVVWLTDGRVIRGPYAGTGVALDYHYGVRIGLLTAMGNIAMANQRILPKIEPVIEAVYLGRPYVNAENIEDVTFTYGPVDWGGTWYFGAMIDLGDVKIQRVAS